MVLAWITNNAIIDTVRFLSGWPLTCQITFPFSDPDAAQQALKTTRRVFFGINGNDIIHIAVEDLDEGKVKQVLGTCVY